MPRDRTLDDNPEARTAAVTESEDLANAQPDIQRPADSARTLIPTKCGEHRTRNVQFWSIIIAARQPLPGHLSACSIAGLSLATGPPRRSAGMPAVASTGWRCSLRRSCLTPVVGRCDSRARAITRGWAPSARLTPDSRSVRGRWGRFLGWAGLDSYGHLGLAGSCRPGQAMTRFPPRGSRHVTPRRAWMDVAAAGVIEGHSVRPREKITRPSNVRWWHALGLMDWAGLGSQVRTTGFAARRWEAVRAGA